MMNYYFEPTQHKPWMAEGTELDVWLDQWRENLKLVCRKVNTIHCGVFKEDTMPAIPDAVQKKAQALAKEEFAAKLAEYPPVNWHDDSDGRSYADVFCPKCGVGRSGVSYHSGTDSSPEHLVWKCVHCGFSWCSKPIDAA